MRVFLLVVIIGTLATNLWFINHSLHKFELPEVKTTFRPEMGNFRILTFTKKEIKKRLPLMNGELIVCSDCNNQKVLVGYRNFWIGVEGKTFE